MSARILTPQLWERIVQEFQVSGSQAAKFLEKLKEEEEEEARLNTCSAILKTGEHKGAVCGKKFKDGMCPIHKVPETPKEPEAESAKCEIVLKSGANEGQKCGKKCAAGAETCAIHSRISATPGDGCAYVFNKGAHKDSSCDKKRCDDSAFCSFHKNAFEKSQSKSESEPKAAQAASGPSKKMVAKPAEPESDSKAEAKSESKVEKPMIRAVRRGAHLVIKGTDLAINSDGTQIIGYTIKESNEAEWQLVKAWTPEMATVSREYDLECIVKEERFVVEDE